MADATAKKTRDVSEECWVLIGARRGRVWYGRRTSHTIGAAHEVEFDGAAVLEREERRGDVVGFHHTHPAGRARPSRRDLDTMRAWVSAFGKPLLCVIDGVDGVAGYRFEHDRCAGVPLLLVERFPRGPEPDLVIGVDGDAG